MNVIEARHVANCRIDGCEFCQSLAAEEAVSHAEEQAEDAMRGLEDDYERRVLGL